MRKRHAIALAGCVVLLGMSQPSSADPLAIAKAFCAAQTAGGSDEMRPLMTRDLRAVVEEAEARDRSIAQSGSGVLSPLAGGVPYQSFAQPAERCVPGKVASASNIDLVDIAYSNRDEANGGWTDQLVLKREDGELRIDDILFANFPTDTYKAGLRRVLADSFDN